MGLTLKWCVGATIMGLCACGRTSSSADDTTVGQGGAAAVGQRGAAAVGQGGAAAVGQGGAAAVGQGGAVGNAAGGQSSDGGAPDEPWSGVFDEAQAGRSATECIALADATSNEMPSGAFTAVLRFDYQTLAPLGHTFVPSGTTLAEESAARASANVVSFPFASTPAGSGELISDPSITGKWVFLTEPSDFGGVAIESSDAALQFTASIVWGGTGEILFPSRWSKSDLGSGCAPKPLSRAASSQVFQLTSEASLDPKVTDLALTTVLPRMWQVLSGGLARTSVFVYPRAVGSFDPAKAEYIVLLDAITGLR